MRWVVNTTPRPFYPRERPGTHCIGGWVGTEPVWMGAEKLAPTGIRSPDRQAHSEWLYRLNYPGSYDQCTRNFIWKICKGERNCYWRRLDNIRRELECLNVLCALSHKFSPFAYTYKFVVQYIGKVIIGKAAGT